MRTKTNREKYWTALALTVPLMISEVLAQIAASAAAPASASESSTGAFASTVAAAGSLIAAAVAIRLCWKGRFNWEPAEEDVPSSSQKVGSLLIGVVIGVLWYKFTQQHSLTPDDLITLSIRFGVAALVALGIYSLLVGVFVYDKIYVVDKKNNVTTRKIIGGLWLTVPARRRLKSDELTIALLFKGSAYDEDRVWPRISRSLAKILFQFGYIGLVAGGTCALAAISLLIASVV